jgi:hypothetical protein
VLQDISYAPVFGKPFLMWLGIIVLACFAATALVGRRVLQGKAKLETHKRAVIASFALAGVHAVLGVLAFF